MLNKWEYVINQETHAMMTAIKAHFEAKRNPEVHDRLYLKAESINIRSKETLKSYFVLHFILRRDMQRAQFPNICDEKTTLKFIVRGVEPRPDLSKHLMLKFKGCCGK